MRLGYTFGGIRDDLLRSGERHLLAPLRHHNEVHRTITADGARFRRPFNTHMDPDRVAASSQQP